MSIKQFPVEFKGYHNGDAGLIYPNSSAMLNCRLNHHDAIEQVQGYGDFFTALSALSGAGPLVGMYEYSYPNTNSLATQAQIAMRLNSIHLSGGVVWGVSGLKLENGNYSVLSGVMDNSYQTVTMADISFRFKLFLGNIISTQLYTLGSSFLSFKSGIYIATTTSNIFTALSVCPTLPAFSEVHYSRLFVGGAAAARNTIYWSDVDTIHTWNASAFLNLNTDDGDYITGIQSFKGDLYAFKYRSVYKIVGDNYNPVSGNYSVVKLEGIPGAINQKAICTANGNMYWVSQKFIVEYNGSSFNYIDYPYLMDDRAGINYDISAEVDPFILQHNESENEIVFFKRGSSVRYNYDYLQKSWSKIDISDTTMKHYEIMEHVSPTTGQKSLVFGSDSGRTYMFGDYDSFLNSVGSAIAINTYYETDWMDCGSWIRKEQVKVFVDTKQDGFLSAHPYSLSCLTYYDYDTVAIDNQVFACDGATNQLHFYYPEVQTFRRIKLRFANNVINTKMQVNRAVVEYDLIDESGRIG